jgi:Ricin-type beta-trefoil lectin domain-like/Protein of unknown function (DUF1800)
MSMRSRPRLRPAWQSLLITGAVVALAANTVQRARANPVVAATESRATNESALQQGIWELVARHSGKCLDVSGGSVDDSAAVIQWTCHGGANQHWIVEPVGDGYYRLVARHSGKALDVSSASQNDSAALIQLTPHDGGNQQWAVESVGEGYSRLIARHSGKALDVAGASIQDGAAVIQLTPHGGANQQWLLRRAGQPPDPGEPSMADVVRFLEQATFGPAPELVEHVRRVGFEAFLNEQFEAPISSYPTLPLVSAVRDTATCPNGSVCQRDNYTMYPLQNRFFVNALYGEDQLRQRVAFALHQIIVVSGVEVTQPSWMAPYLQTLGPPCVWKLPGAAV